MNYSKKAVHSVVVVALLLVVSVTTVLAFQNWFQGFSSSVLSNVEQESSSLGDITFEGVNKGIMYLKGEGEILSVRVNNNDCFVSGTTDSQINSIPFSDCFSEGENEIVIVTKNNVISEKIFLETYNFTSPCPSGYILVPGNVELGTKNFCVMKYEAKDISSVPTSQAVNYPWTEISQIDARAACSSLGSGHSLITNTQWSTIARNIEDVDSNWVDSDGSQTSVGVGAIKQGNVGSSGVTGASYDGTDPEESSDGVNGLGMLTLSNGEEIWDLNGNVREWTNDTSSDALGTDSSGWSEWTEISGYDFLKPKNLSLNSSNGIGTVWTSVGATSGFRRGGHSGLGERGGAFALLLSSTPSVESPSVGFRCSYER